jgi:hypothetical protein
VERKYDYGDLIWYTGDGGRKPGMIVGSDDGFEYEIVHSSNVATTAHITELESRDDG